MARRPAVALVAATAILAASAQTGLALVHQNRPQSPVTGTAALSGVVTDQAVGTPLEGFSVWLYDGKGNAFRATATDEAGRYNFPRLPADTYQISASHAGWLMARYGQKKPDRTGTPVVLAVGQLLENLNIRMFKGGVIAGTVTGPGARPMTGISLDVFRMRYGPDGRFLDLVKSVATDDRGQYRVFDLSPAEYVLRARPPTSSIATTYNRIELDGVQPDPATGYARTYFPGVLSAGLALPIALAAAEERSNIDFALAPVALARIRGRLVFPSGPTLETQFLKVDDDGLLRENEGLDCATGPDGRFVLVNVPPGPLTVLVRGFMRLPASDIPLDLTAGWLWGTARIHVDGRDVSDVTITMQPGPVITGEIRLDKQSTAIDFATADIRMNVEPAGPTGVTSYGRVDRSGHFSIGSVRPGAYHFTVAIKAPWAISSVMHEGRDLTIAAVDVGATDTNGVIVTLTDHRASLSGAFRAPSDVVVADYTIVVFPSEAALRVPHPRAVYAVRPDTAGRYTVPNVLPGDYLVALTDDVEPNSWFDPRVLERLSPGAIRVTIAAGEAKTQDVVVKSPKG
jgi:hypothetical protein